MKPYISEATFCFWKNNYYVYSSGSTYFVTEFSILVLFCAKMISLINGAKKISSKNIQSVREVAYASLSRLFILTGVMDFASLILVIGKALIVSKYDLVITLIYCVYVPVNIKLFSLMLEYNTKFVYL